MCKKVLEYEEEKKTNEKFKKKIKKSYLEDQFGLINMFGRLLVRQCALAILSTNWNSVEYAEELAQNFANAMANAHIKLRAFQIKHPLTFIPLSSTMSSSTTSVVNKPSSSSSPSSSSPTLSSTSTTTSNNNNSHVKDEPRIGGREDEQEKWSIEEIEEAKKNEIEVNKKQPTRAHCTKTTMGFPNVIVSLSLSVIGVVFFLVLVVV